MARILLLDKFDITMLEGGQRWKFEPCESNEEAKKYLGMYDEQMSAVIDPKVAELMAIDLGEEVPLGSGIRVVLHRKGTDLLIAQWRGEVLMYWYCKRT